MVSILYGTTFERQRQSREPNQPLDTEEFMDLGQVRRRERFYKNNTMTFGTAQMSTPWGVRRIDATECPICLESFVAEEKLVRLRCSHVYHEDCLEALLRFRQECPMCKQPIYI